MRTNAHALLCGFIKKSLIMETKTYGKKTLKIDIISDVVCPWCYIGKRRLEKALKSFPNIRPSIQWFPYQLDASIPETGIPRADYLNRKFGSPEKINQIYGTIFDAGKEEGLNFAFGNIKTSPNTLNAHRLIRWSASTGHQDRLVERLFELFFMEGADLGDKNILADAAGDVDMDRDLVSQLLDTDRDMVEVKAQINKTRQKGITGVPCFILGEKIGLIGAQQSDVIINTISQILSKNDSNK